MTPSSLLDRLFLRPTHPFAVRAVRVILAAQALWILLSRPDVPELTAWPSAFWAGLDPDLVLRFGVLFGRVAFERVLFGLLHVALVAAALGLAPRVSCALAGLLLYHFAPFEELLAGVPHAFFGGLTIPALGLLVLSFAEAPGPATVPSPEFGWPLALIRVLFAFNYFAAGLAKLRYTGITWFTGENLRRWVVENAAYSAVPLAGWVAASPALCWALALATLGLEMSFPAAAVSRRAARILVPLAALFHVGIAATLGIFFPSLPLLLLYVDWDGVARRRESRRTASR